MDTGFNIFNAIKAIGFAIGFYSVIILSGFGYVNLVRMLMQKFIHPRFDNSDAFFWGMMVPGAIGAVIVILYKVGIEMIGIIQ